MSLRGDDDAPHDKAEVGSWVMGEKNPAAVALGRLGGKKGGPARAKALTPERRKEIAKKAIEARWAAQRAMLPHDVEGDNGA